MAGAVVLGLVALTGASFVPLGVADERARRPAVKEFGVYKRILGRARCTGGAFAAQYFARTDCGFADAVLDGVSPDAEEVNGLFFAGGASEPFLTVPATYLPASDEWRVAFDPDSNPAVAWPNGPVTIRLEADGEPVVGQVTFHVNQLGARLSPAEKPGGYRPGEPVDVRGRVFQLDDLTLIRREIPVPAEFGLQLRLPSGEVRGPYGPFTADDEGRVDAALPPEATAGLRATRETGYALDLGLDLVAATYSDDESGTWEAASHPAGMVELRTPPDDLVLRNRFGSAAGWVKPGERYPFTLSVENHTDRPRRALVTVPAVDGTSFEGFEASQGTVTRSGGGLRWELGAVDPAGTDGRPTIERLVVDARAARLSEDPRIVWKNLSALAQLKTGRRPMNARSRGPKVIPPADHDTARYGDRPFPVIPVDFRDRRHEDGNTSLKLLKTIDSPDHEGSTFNLFQEMSHGQLFPNANVPSVGAATAGWDYEPGFEFSQHVPQGTCRGASLGTAYDTPLYPERIRNGWYQLPGDTDYYGDDEAGTALVAGNIDAGCGPPSKMVYDAAQIADPEIDYSDFDTNKDGLVDFFMVVYTGAGGNGASQASVPPYDNVWPHSWTLEASYLDEAGQRGYVSDDQLRDHHGRLLWWEDAERRAMTTTDTGDARRVLVRVGPYNVNPETAIDRASVISHEYGHSLGLPDFYSRGDRETYGAWNLMATDHSQHMDVFAKQELGWVVPRWLRSSRTVRNWRDSKENTRLIEWRQPDGTPYKLSGSRVANGEAYTLKLPGRRVLDDQRAPSGSRVWWSGSGNRFGCAPEAGRNIDIPLPELEDVPPGTPVTLSFKSLWEIEWDWDFGYVLTSTDGGETFSARRSEKGYTTEDNPNGLGCQDRYGNGLTGSSGSYAEDSQDIDRIPLVDAYPSPVFLDDEYDLSSLAGKKSVLRFSYFTDEAVVRRGWFVDDIVVRAGDHVIYSSDVEAGESDLRVFNGGCRDGFQSAPRCTAGWRHFSPPGMEDDDHAYYLEMRDRSGFDLDGRGQNDRDPFHFQPGVLVTYTNETRGYGNSRQDDDEAPNQSPLDSQPQPGEIAPELDDASWTPGDAPFSDARADPHVDNYEDADADDGRWRFAYDCLLGLDVLGLTGSELGPLNPPYDLTGDVRFSVGGDCATHTFGGVRPVEANGSPTAVVQAKTGRVRPGERLALDGRASWDDRQAPEHLRYAWDLDGDGEIDARGPRVRHAWTQPGAQRVRLTVTDAGGRSATDTFAVVVGM